jgi:L,D-transpeptidase catalytic domain
VAHEDFARELVFCRTANPVPSSVRTFSSGCIRMLNADVIDLYSLVDVGTKIIVLPNYNNVAAFDAADVALGTLDDLRPSNITKSV